ncbi:MAG: transposase [Cyclobacteriaceae bacterium]|nr:transposase [Cyclobacteriaceae bacterium]
MATKEKYESTTREERQSRYFSESFKRKKVKEIEEHLVSIAEVSREYSVTRNSIYKWIYKYSPHRKKGVKKVIELMSDTRKIKALQERVKELERVVGQKQLLLDFHEKLLELANEEVGFDIKKKYGSKPRSTFGSTEKE